ncbi:MAG: potassium channel family protein [Austwickia sp.]|nr:potassium channel family protein [Austwickia sp.]
MSQPEDDPEAPAARGAVSLPARAPSPWRRLAVRLFAAFATFAFTVAVVYVDRGGYRDSNDDGMSLIDVIYYVTVTLSTTGYGDITPASDSARLINAFVVTPARVVFLVLLIGTTLEVLAVQGREELRISAWRRRMKKHTIVVGYGIKGRSAAATLVSSGRRREDLVIIDSGEAARQEALADGYAVVAGDATRREILTRAGIQGAEQVIVATGRDDANILVTLAVRQLNPKAAVAASVRDRDNAPLLRSSGADAVIVSSDTAGRMLGTSAVSPHLGAVLSDLMNYGQGVEIAEREARPAEDGVHYADCGDRVLGIIRDGTVHYTVDDEVSRVRAGDQLVVVRSARNAHRGERATTD